MAHINTIMLVSSSTSFLQRFQTYLQSVGMISAQSSAKTALQVIKKNTSDIDIIIIDISAPLELPMLPFVKEVLALQSTPVILCQDQDYDISTVPALVELIKLGIYDIVSLPSFEEEMKWVITKALSPSQPNTAPHQLPPAIVRPHPITVLLADDEPHYRNVIEDMLDPYGYHILEADSGKMARSILESHHVDILLLDIALGDEVGESLVPVFKKHYPLLEIIMVTAFKEPELIINTIRNGATDYVVKGTWQSLIPQKIANALLQRG